MRKASARPESFHSPVNRLVAIVLLLDHRVEHVALWADQEEVVVTPLEYEQLGERVQSRMQLAVA